MANAATAAEFPATELGASKMIPATIPPAEIPNDPDWQGAYRLVVAPPLIALDIAWNTGEPLRIMTFSRGDWEGQLRARAG